MNESQLLQGVNFEVDMRPALVSWKGESVAVPERFVTVRTDTGEPLGVVGGRYKVHQHKEAILRTATEVEKLTDNYTVKHVVEGANIYSDFQFPEISLMTGVPHEDVLFGMKLWNNHDGMHILLFQFYGMRLVCTNGMRHFMGIEQLKKAHVKSVSLDNLHVQLPDIIKAHQIGYAEMFNKLADKPMIPGELIEEQLPPRLTKKAGEAYPEEYAVTKRKDAWTQYQAYTRVISHAENQEVWRNNMSKIVTNFFLNNVTI
jgi:hypothetical protein